MKILIFTQKVDKTDPVLGFFHSWIVEFSKQFDSVEVVCLEKGKFDLPINVNVYSLGKPQYQSEARYGAGKFFQKIKYILNLYKYLFLISGSYDRVFVHMNEEYVLLCGLYWKIKGTPVYFWRNHSKGSIWTHIAVILSSKVFCTSSDSFTARFKKTSIMPAGIDTTIFKPLEGIVRKKYSICMVGRISPVKHIDLGLEAFQALVSSGTQASLAIIGPTFPNDKEYLEGLKKYVEDKNLSTLVSFLDPVDPYKLPEVYNSYQICLNLTDSGSLDKTIVEASACGVIPLVANSSLKGILPEVCVTDTEKESITSSLRKLLDDYVRISIEKDLESFVKSQSLFSLSSKLFMELK